MSKVTDIRFVGYGVKNFDAEKDFYENNWGLTEVESSDGMAYFGAAGSPSLYVVRLREAEENRIDVVGLAADTNADVDALYSKVVEAGCKIIFEPKELESLGGGYGFRFFNPDGITLEISAGVSTGEARKVERWEGIPEKVSHIVFHSPDHQAMVKFFTDVLGFRVSDWLGDFMCFLRCNEWHHRIAYLPGPPCLNHVAYDVPSIDDMMRGAARLKKRGIDIGWGPGRHTAGNNTFSYFVTPGGFTVEYTSELEKIDEATWKPTVFEPGPGVMDQWETGVGGPQTLPKPAPDAGLFKAVEV